MASNYNPPKIWWLIWLGFLNMTGFSARAPWFSHVDAFFAIAVCLVIMPFGLFFNVDFNLRCSYCRHEFSTSKKTEWLQENSSNKATSGTWEAQRQGSVAFTILVAFWIFCSNDGKTGKIIDLLLSIPSVGLGEVHLFVCCRMFQ